MGLFDAFKKKGAVRKISANSPRSEHPLGGAYEVIDILWGTEKQKEAVKMFKEAISILIAEGNIYRKTEMLEGGLDICLEHLENAQKNPQLKLGANSITAFIYFRIFLDCVLAIDTDILVISELYTIFRMTKTIRPDMHPFAQMMIKIYDLLDRGIVYLYENMDYVTEDYFLPVEKRIRKMLNAYTDDNTGWNKINPQV